MAKWGGSLLTNKNQRGPPRFRVNAARRLAQAWVRGLNEADERGILVHGAGSFGHPIVKRLGVGTRRFEGSLLRSAFLRVRDDIHTLQMQVVKVLSAAGLPAIGVAASDAVRVESGRVLIDAERIRAFVHQGFHVVTGGDVVFDEDLGLRVMSGDELLVHLARVVSAHRCVFATDVDGVRVGKQLLLELPAEGAAYALGRVQAGGDATGGMRGKLTAALQLQGVGVEALIVNGHRPERFRRAVAGRPVVGTRLPPT